VPAFERRAKPSALPAAHTNVTRAAYNHAFELACEHPGRLSRATGVRALAYRRQCLARLWAALCCGLCACSGSGVGLNADGQPISGQGSGEPVPLSADFDSIQANVFTPICSVCHIGATAPEGLMLDAAHSYSLLVNVPSTEVPSLLRVKPGDPTDSYLIQKLEGHAAVGAQMPFGQPPLPSTTIAFIVQWITDGAAPGSSAGAASAFALEALAPENGAALTAAPAYIALSFTRSLDATRADTSAVRLEQLTDSSRRASGDSSAAAAMESASGADAARMIATRVSVPAGNERTLLVTPLQPLAPGQYRVILSADAASELRALDGASLTEPPIDAAGERVVGSFTVGDGR
jgi:methionine-rich copper-binding protein CopC